MYLLYLTYSLLWLIVLWGIARQPPRWSWLCGIGFGFVLACTVYLLTVYRTDTWALLLPTTGSVLLFRNETWSDDTFTHITITHGFLGSVPLFGMIFGLAFQKHRGLKVVALIVTLLAMSFPVLMFYLLLMAANDVGT
ncbi:MAG TPA: hypothetical protein VJB60_01300 [Candidatus Peribacterales bacterium]|nr:hypothetical protein [Candidatus Peribacterales bacterium]